MAEKLSQYIDKAKKIYEQRELERLGLTPDFPQREMILAYMALILKWNSVSGLISPKDEEFLFIRHFCDSLQPLLLLGFKKDADVLDIGAGGGFPSIPTAIFRPDLKFTLAEPNKKKTAFLNEVIQEVGFTNITVHAAKVEKIDPSTQYDYILSRAFSALTKFSLAAKPYCKTDGRMYTFKTKNFEQELSEITESKEIEGVAISEIAEYDLGTGSNQILGLRLVSLMRLD